MFCKCRLFNFARSKRTVSDKRGFTLLETMLAIALLVVLSAIVYQGFAATMQLSYNTSNFEQAGNDAAGQVNINIASDSVNPLVTPVEAIHIESGSFMKNLGITKFEVAGSPDTAYGVAGYQETGFFDSTNRHGFTYSGKKLTS